MFNQIQRPWSQKKDWIPLQSPWLLQTMCRHRVIDHGEMNHVIILSFSTQESWALIAAWGFSMSGKLLDSTKIAERQPHFGLQHLHQMGTSRSPLCVGWTLGAMVNWGSGRKIKGVRVTDERRHPKLAEEILAHCEQKQKSLWLPESNLDTGSTWQFPWVCREPW